MNIRISLGMALALMLMLGAVIFSITRDYTANEYTQKINDLRAREATQAKYAEVDREVRDAYYGAGTIDENQLLDSVAQGYLDGIGDPYARYIDARTYERQLRSEENQLAGIGALIQATPEGDGYLIVQEVYPDSPALGAGIAVGDLIVRVDETDLTPGNSEEMLAAISGEEATRVTLTVRRGSNDTVVTLYRRIVAVPTVYSQMLENDVGYVLIKDFTDISTVEQFRRELSSLTGAGARSIIFDVRDNPGTSLDIASRVLDRLLPPGIIYSEERREGNQMVVNVAETSDATELDLPMVVLVNEGSSSGAELFALALRDYDRARIVGSATAGKGVVIDTIKLADGSAIEITVAKLITPGGEDFDGVGVRVDYDVSMDYTWQDLPFDQDAQLKKAHEVAISMQRASTAPEGESSQPEEPQEPEVVPPEEPLPGEVSDPEEPGEGEGQGEPSEGEGTEGDGGESGDEGEGEESSAPEDPVEEPE